MTTLAFFDIETSGLDPFKHDVIEFGYVLTDERLTVQAETSFSVPFDIEVADEGALEVNGWGQREFAGEMAVGAAAGKLIRDLAGATMVVNSLQFDLTFTSVFLHRYGQDIDGFSPSPWSHRSVDLKSVTAGRLGLPLHKLTTGGIMRHYGLRNASAHTALGDAWFNLDWYRALGLYNG
jgi:DNA polymerase III epsilon subunit-like protein